MSEKPIPNLLPAIYACILPHMTSAAREHGYALAVHGSLVRDFDVVAIPWKSDAGPAATVAEAIRASVGGVFSEYDNNGSPTEKPHGRRCWTVHLGGGTVDLSVMPRTSPVYYDGPFPHLLDEAPAPRETA
jgi:hypothetical protein